MTYHGRVHPGGVPQVRVTEHWAMTKASVGAMDNNVYLLRCQDTGGTLLIDAAGAEPGRFDVALAGLPADAGSVDFLAGLVRRVLGGR